MPDDQQKAESLGIRETIQTRNCGKIGRGAERIFSELPARMQVTRK